MSIHQWAIQWGVPAAAVYDLQRRLGLDTPVLPPDAGAADDADTASESRVQSLVRLEAAQKGVRLWRNNVGALMPKDSKRLVRFGLANDSEQLNDILKSADLIGWRSVRIEPAHVGCVFAQFVSREIKEEGWQYTGQEREPAQKAWADMVNAAGGDAGFATGVGTL